MEARSRVAIYEHVLIGGAIVRAAAFPGPGGSRLLAFIGAATRAVREGRLVADASQVVEPVLLAAVDNVGSERRIHAGLELTHLANHPRVLHAESVVTNALPHRRMVDLQEAVRLADVAIRRDRLSIS